MSSYHSNDLHKMPFGAAQLYRSVLNPSLARVER